MKIEKIIKILIVIFLVLLLVQLRITPLDSCDTCKFNINGTETKGGEEFMKLYSDECFIERRLDIINIENG